MDVLNIIYDHISIKYDTTIFEFQEKMLYDVFYEEEKNNYQIKIKLKLKIIFKIIINLIGIQNQK